MDKTKNRPAEPIENCSEDDENGNYTVILKSPEKEERIVCDVCGFANPPYTAICKKCSNYLDK